MVTVPTKVLFSPVPLAATIALAQQATWRPVPNTPDGLGWLDWFGFIGIADVQTGMWSKSPVASSASPVLQPANMVWFDGARFYAQPGYDFVNDKPVVEGAPAFFYAAGAVGTA